MHENLLRFGIIHYGGTYNTLLKSVVMNQRHALRTIYNIKRMERVSYIFSLNNILTFDQLHNYSVILHIQKYISDFYFRETCRVTRSAQNLMLEIPFLTKESSRHQFCYLGPKIFNSFLLYSGHSIIFEKKPKVKLKALEYVKTL